MVRAETEESLWVDFQAGQIVSGSLSFEKPMKKRERTSRFTFGRLVYFVVGKSAALTGLGIFLTGEPRALPWAIICRAFSPSISVHQRRLAVEKFDTSPSIPLPVRGGEGRLCVPCVLLRQIDFVSFVYFVVEKKKGERISPFAF